MGMDRRGRRHDIQLLTDVLLAKGATTPLDTLIADHDLGPEPHLDRDQSPDHRPRSRSHSTARARLGTPLASPATWTRAVPQVDGRWS